MEKVSVRVLVSRDGELHETTFSVLVEEHASSDEIIKVVKEQALESGWVVHTSAGVEILRNGRTENQ